MLILAVFLSSATKAQDDVTILAAAADVKTDDKSKADDKSKTDDKKELTTEDLKKMGWFNEMWVHPGMKVAGCILMTMLITLSNAGGLSGGGSNIPIMLIFFDFDMHRAVPLSAFVAFCATFFRFLINWNLQHPKRPRRKAINYEIVNCAICLVFCGGLIGVLSGPVIGETAQECVFGIVICWSIYTSGKKAIEIYRKEKLAARIASGEESAINEKTELIDKDEKTENEGGDDDGTPAPDAEPEDELEEKKELDTPEMRDLYHNEERHFTLFRCSYYLINFSFLFGAQFVLQDFCIPLYARLITFFIFIALMIFSTRLTVRRTNLIHQIKQRDNYNYDDNDLQFHGWKDILKLAVYCGIAAMLCGMTGIAGGMVLGPLFLKYNMIPQVMSSTN